jgi:Cu/Zn superoxide dismutase
MRYFTWPLAWVSFAWSLTAYAAEFNVDVHSVDAKGVGSSLGAIAVKETGQGLVFTPQAQGPAAGSAWISCP